GEIANSEVAKSLMGLFESITDTKKQFDKDQAKEIHTLGILGGGLMGSGIASVSINNEIRVRLKDQNEVALSRCYQYVNKFIQEKVKKKHLLPYEGQMQLDKFSTTTDYSGLKSTQVIIEAIFEDVALKQKVLAEIEALGKDSLIFASNTSCIPIGLIAEKAKRKDLVVGMHFFSPVEKMPLLEVIATPQTAEWVTATAANLGIQMGKTVIIVNDGWGFYTSRTLAPFINEALHLLMEGAKVEAIDKTLMNAGFPVGALKLLDEVGIDIAMKVNKLMEAHMGGRLTPPKGVDTALDADRKGRKSGKGFYTYNTKKKMVDLSIYDKLPGGRKRKDFSREEILERCLFAFINEAAYCLSENILRTPADGDVGAIMGLGFPPYMGGPFRMMDRLGLTKTYDTLKRLAEKHGERFKPAPVIEEYAKQNKKFFPDG
ncbi:MAG: 3-hydroxyacyl-CoA dehydrogenase NAD-binding domain-containing protein, partial [Planctomycetota bacterium]